VTPARDRGTTRRRWPSPSPRSLRPIAFAIALVVATAGCGATTPEPASTAGPSASQTVAASSAVPADSATPGGTATDGTDTSPSPAESPTATGLPNPSDGGGALGCSGDEKNRSFFAAAAANLPWDVYCGVLPDGWFVEAGNYRLAGGGTLRITYDGPNGARLELREGGVCGESSDCQPSGEALGPAAYGNRAGSLVALDGGGYEIVVDPDQPLSWLAISDNLDEPAFRDIAAALLLVSP
jgi:hypothetical protein